MLLIDLNKSPYIYKYFGFPEYDKECLADVIGQQRMITPPWHLILTLIFGLLLFCILPWTFDFEHFSLSPLVIFTTKFESLIPIVKLNCKKKIYVQFTKKIFCMPFLNQRHYKVHCKKMAGYFNKDSLLS